MGSTTISAPTPPSYGQSMSEILQAQLKYAPDVYAAESQYQPLYAKLQAQTGGYLAQQALTQAANLYPQVSQIESAYNAANRAAEIQQLQQTLPQYQKSLETITPGYQQTLQNLGTLAQQQSALAAQAPQFQNYAAEIGGPTSGQYLSQAGTYTPGAYSSAVAGPAEVGYMGQVGQAQMQSGLNQINPSTVQQYMQLQPGAEQYAQSAAGLAQQELAAGKGLTPEEQRMAEQAARSAYAARGTALGPQSIAAEILGRADVAQQRYQQRLANAANLQGQVQQMYAPALAQSLARQQAAEQYGLAAQGQAFGQAAQRESVAQQIQGQQYSQAMGREQLAGTAQQQAFQQASAQEQLGLQTQAQQLGQALQRQQADIQSQQAAQQLQSGRAQFAAGSLAQMQAAQAPILQAFYKQPILQGQIGAAQSLGMASQQQMGPQFFNPESQTGMSSIYGAYNAQMGLAAANAQASAGKQSGMMQGLGALGGGMMGGPLGAMAGTKLMSFF